MRCCMPHEGAECIDILLACSTLTVDIKGHLNANRPMLLPVPAAVGPAGAPTREAPRRTVCSLLSLPSALLQPLLQPSSRDRLVMRVHLQLPILDSLWSQCLTCVVRSDSEQA